MDDSLEFHQPFPKKHYKKYLKIVNTNKTKELTIFQMEQVFLLSIRDYIKGILTVDDLASIASELFHGCFITKDFFSIQLENGEIQSLLLETSELSYYARRVDKSYPQAIGNMLLALNEYYSKHITSVPRDRPKTN